MFGPADRDAEARGLRLIAPDRPGYGISSPMPRRSLADWTADVAALMDHLAVARAPVLAISGGGPYAVATAARLKGRITGLALVSPLGEIGARAAHASVGRLARAFFLGLPQRPRLLRRGASIARAGFLAAPGLACASFVAMLPPADRRVLTSQAARELVIGMTREALRQGIEGAVSDMAVFAQPWRLDLGTVTVPAVLWQGTADAIVPAALAFELADRLGNCRTHRLEGQGHFWVIDHIPEVLEAVAGL
jgi:pimeloyl-ACP methyl ester carboxylesterase